MSSSSIEDQAAREAQASEEEHRRRLANRQRLRELRIKRLRAKVWTLSCRFLFSLLVARRFCVVVVVVGGLVCVELAM